MIRWYVFGDAVLAEVEAPCHERALQLATERFGGRVRRVQSVVSVEVTNLELTGRLLRDLYGRRLAPGLAQVILVPAATGGIRASLFPTRVTGADL